MPKNKSICECPKCSKTQATLTERHPIYQVLKQETELKNEAFFFLISLGLYDAFEQYRRNRLLQSKIKL